MSDRSELPDGTVRATLYVASHHLPMLAMLFLFFIASFEWQSVIEPVRGGARWPLLIVDTTLQFFAGAYVAFVIHQYVLSVHYGYELDSGCSFLGFCRRTFVLGLLYSAIIVGGTIALIVLGRGVIGLIVMLATFVISIVMYAKWATWLPGGVVNQGYTFEEARARGSDHWRAIVTRSLWLFFFAMLPTILVSGVLMAFSGDGYALLKQNSVFLSGDLRLLIRNVFSAAGATLMAVGLPIILCRAYDELEQSYRRMKARFESSAI